MVAAKCLLVRAAVACIALSGGTVGFSQNRTLDPNRAQRHAGTNQSSGAPNQTPNTPDVAGQPFRTTIQTGSPAADATAQPSDQAMGQSPGTAAEVEIRRLSELLNMDIRLADGDVFGSVTDIAVGSNGQVLYLVTSYDGEFIPVPFHAFSFAELGSGIIVLPLDRALLLAAPRFSDFADLSAVAFRTRLNQFFADQTGLDISPLIVVDPTGNEVVRSRAFTDPDTTPQPRMRRDRAEENERNRARRERRRERRQRAAAVQPVAEQPVAPEIASQGDANPTAIPDSARARVEADRRIQAQQRALSQEPIQPNAAQTQTRLQNAQPQLVQPQNVQPELAPQNAAPQFPPQQFQRFDQPTTPLVQPPQPQRDRGQFQRSQRAQQRMQQRSERRLLQEPDRMRRPGNQPPSGAPTSRPIAPPAGAGIPSTQSGSIPPTDPAGSAPTNPSAQPPPAAPGQP